MYENFVLRDLGLPRWPFVDEMHVGFSVTVLTEYAILVSFFLLSCQTLMDGWLLRLLCCAFENPFFCTTRDKVAKAVEAFAT